MPEGLLDPYGIFAEAEPKRHVLERNPFKLADDDIFQHLCIIDDRIVGTSVVFPNKLLLDGKYYSSIIGNGLSVQKECRGKGIGSKLTDSRLDLSRTRSLVLCGSSQMQLPILKRLGAHIFLLPRMILLLHSFSVLESKLGAALARVLAPVVDVAFRLQQSWLKHKRRWILSRGFDVKELDVVPGAVEEIIAADGARFRECHTAEWFNWIKDNNLVDDSRCRKRFYMAIDATGRPVGFFMTRQRFYEQASHRGFKNLMMGSVLEWGTADANVISDNELCLLALTSFGSDVDAVELCCTGEAMAAWFRRKGLVRVGDGNIVVRYRHDSLLASIEGIGDADNWRLRPAMGDNGLS